MSTPLYHVGCGRYLFDRERANGMAMACLCGANAPVMVEDLQCSAIDERLVPASIAMRMGEWPMSSVGMPHLEYYLGFDYDFSCAAKLAWEAALRLRGCISCSECDQERCREQPQRHRERAAYFGPAAPGEDKHGG